MLHKIAKALGLALAIGLSTTIGLANADETAATRDVSALIEAYLNAVESEFGIVGQSISVLSNGKSMHSSARGKASIELDVPATQQTVFQVFSIAKLFVHVTLMQLSESGAIDLDAPITAYVIGLPDQWAQITVRQSLSHMSGLPEYYQRPEPTPQSAQEAIASVAGMNLVFEPGSNTSYNQTNYLLLKMVIEAVTGSDFVSVVYSRMINATRLENTYYGGEFAVIPGRATMYRATPNGLKRNRFIDQPDYMFASSGLNSTASDLAKWFSALLRYKLIKRSTLSTMWVPSRLNDNSLSPFANGWEYSRRGEFSVFGHGGGNRADVRHYVRDSDGESVTVIYLTNGSKREFWPGRISNCVAEIVFREKLDCQ